MKITRREFNLLLLLLVVAGTAAYIYFYWMPMSAKNAALDIKIQDQLIELDDRANTAALWASLQSEVDANTEIWQDAQKKLPEVFDQSQVIHAVTAITSPYSTDVAMQFLEREATLSALVIHPVRVTLSADYDSIAAMLRAFQNQGVDCRVTDVSMQELGLGTGHYGAAFTLQYPVKSDYIPTPEELMELQK